MSKKKIPVMVVAPAAMLAVEMATRAIQTKGNMTETLYPMTGYANGQMHWDRLAASYGPIVIGVILHKTVGKAINRYVPKGSPISA
jgi:hypothetical protein